MKRYYGELPKISNGDWVRYEDHRESLLNLNLELDSIREERDELKTTLNEWKQLARQYQQERDQLKAKVNIALELCTEVENDLDLPPVKWALRCARLINKLRNKQEEEW